MYMLRYSFTFDAAHRLQLLPDTHKCSQLHGHTWKVTLVLQSPKLNHYDFVIDFAEIKETWQKPLEQLMDHRCLNDSLIDMMQPTCENLAKYIFEHVVKQPAGHLLHAVEVQETEGHSVAYWEE